MQTIYEGSSYAWQGLNFCFYAIGICALIGVAIALGYSLQDWLNAASERRAEFIKSIQKAPAASGKGR